MATSGARARRRAAPFCYALPIGPLGQGNIDPLGGRVLGAPDRSSAMRWATESAEEMAIAGGWRRSPPPSRSWGSQHTHSEEAQIGPGVNPAIDRVRPPGDRALLDMLPD